MTSKRSLAVALVIYAAVAAFVICKKVSGRCTARTSPVDNNAVRRSADTTCALNSPEIPWDRRGRHRSTGDMPSHPLAGPNLLLAY